MVKLIKKIEERLMDPELNSNFNKEVTREKNVTDADERNYQLAHKEFQDYKNADKK